MFFYHRHHYLLDGVVVLALLGLWGHHEAVQPGSNPSRPATEKQVSYSPTSNRQLARLNYQSGRPGFIVVNHDKAKLRASEWRRDGVHYAKPDSEHRTSRANVGTLDRANVADDSLRTRQTVMPTGYHQKFAAGEPIINRGHEIAYSLSKGISRKGVYDPKAKSGDQNDPRNLFTQTAFSNQELQTVYEAKVRHALEDGEHVVYSVQPIFKGRDLMAKGVHMQALSTNGRLDYNVYIYNVQPGVVFDYANGTSRTDRAMKVPTPPNAPHFNDDRNSGFRHARRFIRNGRYPHHGFGGRYYYPRRHHFLRDYLMYRGAKSLWRRHEYDRMRRHGFGMIRRRPGLFHRHAYSRF